MKSLVFVSVLLSLNLAWVRLNCVHEYGNCNYYFCQEEIHHCGPEGYYIDFGLKYCYKYQEAEKNFSEQGKKFLQDVRLCLQKAAERNAHEGLLCVEVKPINIWSHPDCYIESGYCNLSLSEKMMVVDVALAEVFNTDVVSAFTTVEARCLADL